MEGILDAARRASFIYAFEKARAVSDRYGPEETFVMCYKLSGDVYYYQGEHVVNNTPGKLVIIPKNSCFYTKITEAGSYLEIKFDSPTPTDTKIQRYSGFNTREMEMAFRAAIAACSERNGAGYFECQAQMNRIFSMLYRCSDSYLTSHDMELLNPAIEYVKANVFNPGFSVREMQSLVDVSDTYFRQLFIRYYKVPPKRYVINERIQLAKVMMTENPSMPLQYVAEAVGFTDVYYFYRIFKRETGMPPGQFERERKLHVAGKH